MDNQNEWLVGSSVFVSDFSALCCAVLGCEAVDTQSLFQLAQQQGHINRLSFFGWNHKISVVESTIGSPKKKHYRSVTDSDIFSEEDAAVRSREISKVQTENRYKLFTGVA